MADSAHQMPLLCIVVLTKNSSDQVKKNLSLFKKFSEQVVFFDDESSDFHLLEALSEVGVQSISHALDGHFAAQRNAALQYSRAEYTLFLDADEIPSEEFFTELRQTLQEQKPDGVFIQRRDWFLGKQLRYGETGQMKLLRCAKTTLGQNRWQRSVHEVWAIESPRLVTLGTPIWHEPATSISAFMTKLSRYAAQEAQARPRYALWRVYYELAFYPPGKFLYALLWQQGWRDGIHGVIHAFLMAYYSLILRVFLYEARFTPHPSTHN